MKKLFSVVLALLFVVAVSGICVAADDMMESDKVMNDIMNDKNVEMLNTEAMNEELMDYESMDAEEMNVEPEEVGGNTEEMMKGY